MYIPADFEIPNIDVMHQLIKQHALGILFTHGNSGLDANHIPFELSIEQSELGILHAHVSRNNPVWQDIQDGDEVLVVFRAGDAYISPNCGIRVNMNIISKFQRGTTRRYMHMAL